MSRIKRLLEGIWGSFLTKMLTMMNNYEVDHQNEMERHLHDLIGEFQRSIIEGKPFSEVKAIYLEIKEVKIALARRSDGDGGRIKGLSFTNFR
jgi:hypothetical protein